MINRISYQNKNEVELYNCTLLFQSPLTLDHMDWAFDYGFDMIFEDEKELTFMAVFTSFEEMKEHIHDLLKEIELDSITHRNHFISAHYQIFTLNNLTNRIFPD